MQGRSGSWFARRCCVLALALAMQVAAPWRHASADPTAVDLGTLVGPAGVVRDGGESVRLGDRVLWLFGDTLYPGCVPVCASNSAGLGTARGPAEELGAEFVPLTPDERAAWHAGDDRVAVWPTGAVRTSATTAAVFFSRYHVTGPLAYAPLGWGVATVRVGDRTATRVMEMEGSPFGHPLRVGSRVYVYACDRRAGIEFACRTARAPVAGMTDPASWRYRTADGWSADPDTAAFPLIGPSGGLSVSWNRSLGRYLATYNLALTNRVEFRTAPSPTGPWSVPATLLTGLATPAGMHDYAGFEHPELARDGGRVITLTYVHPLGSLRAEIRRVSVTLGP